MKEKRRTKRAGQNKAWRSDDSPRQLLIFAFLLTALAGMLLGGHFQYEQDLRRVPVHTPTPSHVREEPFFAGPDSHS